MKLRKPCTKTRAATYPNRIRELRHGAGMTTEDVAKIAGTTPNQISRLELGQRNLTQGWMERIARALRCSPSDLLATASVQVSDVEPDDEGDLGGQLKAVGVQLYRVIGTSVEDAGLMPGKRILITSLAAGFSGLKTGDVTLVSVGSVLLLRIFVAPALLVTNQRGANTAFRIDDPTKLPECVGVWRGVGKISNEG